MNAFLNDTGMRLCSEELNYGSKKKHANLFTVNSEKPVFDLLKS